MVSHKSFRISSALKDIIGRDLITNDFVAVFELVKNAFDAYASSVDIEIGADSITIVDNGKGMSRDDVIKKWLFVAYSAKADGSEDDKKERDYRDRIKVKRGFAGSKGIGRFSCDRLGKHLDLYAKQESEERLVHLSVDWEKFEKDALQEFEDIKVRLENVQSVPKPEKAQSLNKSGVMLRISGLNEEWDDIKIKRLRTYLARLVDPFTKAVDLKIRTFPLNVDDKELIGDVGNNVVDILEQKTTYIEVSIKNNIITSTLADRGTLVYRIEEDSPYAKLSDITVIAKVFYLNRSAKQTFTMRMGVAPTQFGNLFLYVNGFRVFPIGEPTDDTFGINRRKTQGSSRFLGLRDIVGTIRIEAPPRRFREASSRDNGLTENGDVLELYQAIMDHVVKRLERYVTKVAWPDPLEQDRDNTIGLRTNAGRTRVVEVINGLVGVKGMRLIDVGSDLVDVVEERAKEFERTMGSLVSIAEKTGDEQLLRRVEQSRVRYEELQSAEREAREAAEKADESRTAAERATREAIASEAKAKGHADTLDRQVKLLGAAQNRDSEQLNLMLHQVVIYATELDSLVRRSLKKIRSVDTILASLGSTENSPERVALEDAASLTGRIGMQSRRIQVVGKVTTQASIPLQSGSLDVDIIQYMNEYIEDVVAAYAPDINISFMSNNVSLTRRFAPIDVAVLIDNMVSNAKKQRASAITFSCAKGQKKGTVKVTISDDGKGIDERFVDPSRIFQKAYTGNKSGGGSGLGLYHARQVAEELGGSLALDPMREDAEARFVLIVPEDNT